MNERVVRREAKEIACDARKTRNLSDAESECLCDLLASDEAFGLLVSAQQAAVMVSADEHDIDAEIEDLAREGATPLGNAIDRVVEDRISDARSIVAFAERAGEPVTWGVAISLYQSGFTSVEDLRETSLHELVADAGVAPALAERIKTDVGGREEVEG